jgi:hypothetical protein
MAGNRFFALVALTSACSVTARTGFDYQSRVGLVVARDTGAHCLSIRAQDLRPGAQLALADPTDSAAVIKGVITGSIDGACRGEGPGPEHHFYGVRVESQVTPQPGTVWFALLLPDGILKASPRGIEGDIDGDGTVERLRVCTSNEGLHLTIWSGEPLVGPRRWHRYFYLGYDVEPSCAPKDYEGSSAQRRTIDLLALSNSASSRRDDRPWTICSRISPTPSAASPAPRASPPSRS